MLNFLKLVNGQFSTPFTLNRQVNCVPVSSASQIICEAVTVTEARPLPQAEREDTIPTVTAVAHNYRLNCFW